MPTSKRSTIPLYNLQRGSGLAFGNWAFGPLATVDHPRAKFGGLAETDADSLSLWIAGVIAGCAMAVAHSPFAECQRTD